MTKDKEETVIEDIIPEEDPELQRCWKCQQPATMKVTEYGRLENGLIMIKKIVTCA